jgi:hypothetical protein
MGLFFAWAVGEAIISYRWVKAKAPPTPGSLLLPTALYLSLAILAEYQPARATATVFAWATNLAILMQVVGKVPAQQTGWPPPKLAATVIWPGGSSSKTGGGTANGTGFGAVQGSAISESEQAGGLLPKAVQQVFGDPFAG